MPRFVRFARWINPDIAVWVDVSLVHSFETKLDGGTRLFVGDFVTVDVAQSPSRVRDMLEYTEPTVTIAGDSNPPKSYEYKPNAERDEQESGK